MYCNNCIHKEVCGKEGCGDPAMTFCYDKSADSIPVWWLIDRIDETEDKLFELTKDKNRAHSLDEIRAFTELDIYAYTLRKIYCDYTGEWYEGNNWMLRREENDGI